MDRDQMGKVIDELLVKMKAVQETDFRELSFSEAALFRTATENLAYLQCSLHGDEE